MALIGANQRIANYTYGLNPTRIGEDLTELKPVMLTNFGTSARLTVEIHNKVRGVLAGEEVPGIDYSKYLAFAVQVWSSQRKLGGGTALTTRVAAVIAYWTNLGLTQSVLEKIRDEVFAIPAPAP